MGSIETDWVVITGAPSSGKTSVIRELEKRGYKVQDEAARNVIEQKLQSGMTSEELMKDRKMLQQDIVEKEQQFQKNRRPEELVFLDRSMGDRIGYDRYLGIDNPDTLALAGKFRYKAVFIMDRLSFVKDGVRLENDCEAELVGELLEKGYRELGYDPIHVPVMSIEERADFIVEKLGLA